MKKGVFALRLIYLLHSAFLINSSLLQSICFIRLWTLIDHSIKFVMSQFVAMKKSYCMTYGGLYTLKIVKMKRLVKKIILTNIHRKESISIITKFLKQYYCYLLSARKLIFKIYLIRRKVS